MRILSLFLVVCIAAACSRKTSGSVSVETTIYQATDLTAENIFSRNIEGPAVDKNGQLFVVNFQKDGTIGKVSAKGEVELFVTLPDKSIANSIQFAADGHMRLADFTGHNILDLDPVTKNVTVYCHDDRFNQPNDLCISGKGIIFASDPNWQKQTGQIWRIGTDRKAVLLHDKMGTTNGICLSPDEKTLYVNESVQRRIWAFDVNEKGEISNQRIFAVFDDFGFDGMKCDVKGNLYVTRYGKGTIAILNPEGKLIREVTLRGKDVSNITFGGKDGRTCFVTLQDRKCMEQFRTENRGK